MKRSKGVSSPRIMLSSLRKHRRRVALAVLTALAAAWLWVFCDQCWNGLSASATHAAPCCPSSHVLADDTRHSPCGSGAAAPCLMATALDHAPEDAAIVPLQHLPGQVFFLLALVLLWPAGRAAVMPARGGTDEILRYDPRRLKRVRLLLI